MASTSKSKRAAKKSPKEISAESKERQPKGETRWFKDGSLVDIGAASSAATNPVPKGSWSENGFYGSAADAAAPQTGSEVMGLSRDQRDTPDSITSVISFLQTLGEMLPGVVQAANHGPNDWIPWTSHGMLFRGVDMLRRYRETRRRIEKDAQEMRARDIDRVTKQALNDAEQKGIALGIEQEKQRVKEARRGRNQKY